MEAYIEHMRTSAGATALAHFESLGTSLAQFIEFMGTDKEWVRRVLEGLGVHTSGPPGAERLNRGTGLLRAYDDKQWDQFCRHMWMFTIPKNEGAYGVFKVTRRVRRDTDLDDAELVRLDIFEDLCREFNRQLGMRCSFYADRALAQAKTAAAKAGETRRVLVQAQDVVLGVLLAYFERDAAFQAEFQRMGKTTYQYKKCAVALRAPDDEIPDVLEGGVDWFFKLWDVLEEEHHDQFCRAMAAKLNGRGETVARVDQLFGARRVVRDVTVCDLYVECNKVPRGMQGRKGPWRGVPVVFYLKSGLEELAAKTFNAIVYETGSQQSAFEQAIEQLTEPHQEYDDFRAKAYDLPEARGDHFMQSRLVSTRVGGLDQLLSELRVCTK
jgi:hypothetical protein